MQPLDTLHGLKNGKNRHKPDSASIFLPGFQLLFYSRKASIVAVAKIPDRLCCYGKLVHSSVIISILEELMSRTARLFLEGASHTEQMTVAFMKPLHNTGTLKAEGRILKVRGRNMATIEGVMLNDRKEVSAKSTSEWVVTPIER
jgi:acyl-coenzyme A thioesterase PaaI-like protein